MKNPRVPAYRRLKELKPLFSLHDMRMRHSMTPETARNALSRWKQEGLVSPVGPKAGWYYNLVADPNGPDTHLGEALTAVFGTAILIGATVLNDRGWTPQQPHVTSVAVPLARSYPKIEGAQVYGRPPAWFACVHAAVNDEMLTVGRGRFGLPSLPPEYALADMLKHEDCLLNLAPDDITIPEDDVNTAFLNEAFTALELPQDLYEPYLEASDIERWTP